MSDSSGDSSVGVEFCTVDTVFPNQNSAQSQEQESGHTDSSSESESESSSDEDEDSNPDLVESTPMTKKLGYVEIFSMKTKVDDIHVWLKGLENDSTDDHVTIHKSTLCLHRRAANALRHCLRDAAPMAVKTSQYMDTSVKKYIVTKVDKVITKMLRSEGAGSIAMKKLLGQSTFKTQLLQDIHHDVLKDDDFPHEKPSLLLSAIGEVVDGHLGRALLKQAQKQTEADLLEKFNADKKKAFKGVEDELRSAGLME